MGSGFESRERDWGGKGGHGTVRCGAGRARCGRGAGAVFLVRLRAAAIGAVMVGVSCAGYSVVSFVVIAVIVVLVVVRHHRGDHVDRCARLGTDAPQERHTVALTLRARAPAASSAPRLKMRAPQLPWLCF